MKADNIINELIEVGFDGNSRFSLSLVQDDKVELIRPIIKQHFVQTKSINHKTASVTIKGHLEKKIMSTYISNEDLIYAMYLEGYHMKCDGINTFFNVSQKCLITLREFDELYLIDY